MMLLQIKKSSDALLKSDARADQNQVIFFTSPNAAFLNIFRTQVYKCVGRKCAKNQRQKPPRTQIRTTLLGA